MTDLAGRKQVLRVPPRAADKSSRGHGQSAGLAPGESAIKVYQNYLYVEIILTVTSDGSVAAKLADNFVPSSVQIAPASLRCIAHIHTRCATQKSLLFNHAPLAPGKIAATPFWIIVSVAHFLPGEAWFK